MTDYIRWAHMGSTAPRNLNIAAQLAEKVCTQRFLVALTESEHPMS